MCIRDRYIALQKQLNENRAEIMMLSESSAPIEEKSAELHDLKEKNLQICISLFEATEGYKKLNELKNMKPGKRILKIQDYRERIIGDIRESFLDVMNNLRENCRSLTNEDLFYCLLSLLHCPKDLLLGIMDASSDAIKARKHRIKDKICLLYTSYYRNLLKQSTVLKLTILKLLNWKCADWISVHFFC